MAQHLEIVALGDLILGVFDQLAFKFLNIPAFQADEMVVMFLFDFVACDAVVEIPLRGQSRLDEQFHRSVDGRVPDIGMRFPHGPIEIFAGDVTLGFKEGGEYQFSLLRMFELVLLQVGAQRFDLDFMGHGGTISLPESDFLPDVAECGRLLE